MVRARAGVRQSAGFAIRGLALGLTGALVASLVTADSADARGRRHRAKIAAAKVERYNPPYAAIVVDGNSGAVLHSDSPDAPRHPASLTKIMTLYLLFERLEAGKIKPSTELAVSEHASTQAPSKLALKPGETINVENAIRAVVTKSANDVAVVIAESLGGTESEFARMMTSKARAIGMTNTTYRNASGLPDEAQLTTARDQALLGRTIQERFPKYYRYFATPSFSYRGHAIRNHNKLLGTVEGVDGIKTGFTNASGFNLVTSMKRGGRQIVAAVFGGRTANWRDGRMRELIGKYIKIASLDKKPLQPPAAADSDKVAAAPAPVPSAPPLAYAATPSGPAPQLAAIPAARFGPPPGSTEPIKPNAVKTYKVKAANMKVLGEASPADNRFAPVASAGSVTTISTVKSADTTNATTMQPLGAKPGILGTIPAKALEAQNSVPADAKFDAKMDSRARPGWMIQVGAFPGEPEAKQRLAAARAKATELGHADPFTEKVAKGDKTLYRARFAGMDKDQAENACKTLRRGEIPCMLMKN
jgi:D-alanyl-D-alanine carboxypeptidase